MSILYIRHGEDKKSKHKYDEKLTEEGIDEVEKFTLELIENFGIPDFIFYSPFYRTWKTKRIMIKTILKTKGVKVDTKVEPRIGRFFTKKQSKNPDIHPKTLSKNPIIYENYLEFQERVDSQFDEIEKDKNIWNITHSLVILRLMKRFNIERSKHIEYLDYIEIK
jgi:broad specificity phosphatase PhoE